MRRTLLIPTALVVSALALAGCAAGNSSSSSSRPGGAVAPQTQQLIEGGTPVDGSKTFASDTVQSADRKVVETGYATIVVDKPLDAAGDAVRITEQSGGRVDGRNEYAPTEGNEGSATLTLRIPVAALDATLDKLKALGTVQEVSLSSSDVTMQSQDLDARIKALSATVDRLIALLATASDTDTLIKLETAISDRQGELESLQSQQRYLADQVAMSTVTLNLVSPSQAVVNQPNNFLSGLAAGWAAFVAFFAGLLVALGVLLPWLVLAAIVVTVIVLIVRRTRRRGEMAPVGTVGGVPAPESEPAAGAPKAAPARSRKP
ncbi:hypothetical protein BH11ACT4_BH11ACT4_08730 [soil metagenome]